MMTDGGKLAAFLSRRMSNIYTIHVQNRIILLRSQKIRVNEKNERVDEPLAPLATVVFLTMLMAILV